MGDEIDLSALAVERWREKQLEAVLRSDLATLRASYESPWCAAQHVDSLPPALTVQSPLVWAVLTEDAALVRFLMTERTERIPFPHVTDCGCSLCRELRADARLRRLYAERLLPALASPLYLAHRAPDEDVLQQSLNLMRRLSCLDVLTCRQRRDARDRGCRTLAMLLDAAWTRDEAFALLLDIADPEDRLGRVRVLADLGLREPLAHQTVQLVLDAAWTRGFQFADALPAAGLLRALTALLGYALTPLYLICPHPRLRPLCQSARFAHSLDAVAFVGALGLVIAWLSSARDLNNGVARAAVCGADQSGTLVTQIIFLIFVAASAVKDAQHLLVLGLRRLLRATGFFGLLHHLAVVCYLAGLPLTLVWASRLRQMSDQFLATQANSTTSLRACLCAGIDVSSMMCAAPTSVTCQGVNYTAAYANLLLDSLQPQVIGSLAMGCGHALLLLSFFSVAALQRHVGTLVVSLSRVLKDVVNFGAALLVVIFAWTCLLVALYRVVSCSSPQFQTDGSVFKTLAWSLFTMSDRDDHLLVGAAQHSNLRLLELLGLLAHVSFVFVGAVVLINLLVAMMSETFICLAETRESDWLYRASLTKIKYLNIGPDLPVPFNLLWPLHLLTLMAWDRVSAAMRDGPVETPLTYLRQSTRLDYATALSRARQRLKMQLLARTDRSSQMNSRS